MRIVRFLALALTTTGIADAADQHTVKIEHLPFIQLSDEEVFACACPGVVEFCKEWKEKWAKDAAPEVRDQSVRECVIDMTRAIEGP